MSEIAKLSDTIKPKSDQTNADDLLAGPITVKITGVERGNAEQPIRIKLDGGFQPYYPCKSMRRVLIAAWGDDGREWVGRGMTLFADPEVAFGGVKVGGIRISHMTNINGPQTFMLTTTRGKKKSFSVSPLAAAAETTPSKFWPQDKFSAKLATVADRLKSGELTEPAAVAGFERVAPLTSAQKSEITALTPTTGGEDQF